MDLRQRKLNKIEWDSIEIPVSVEEKTILKLIQNGFHSVNIRMNNTNSLFAFLKIEYSEKMEDYLYNKYFRNECDIIEQNIKLIYNSYIGVNVNSNVLINSADKIRLERNDDKTIKKHDLYEFVLIKYVNHLLECVEKKKNNDKFMFYYFTLFKLIRNNVTKVNRHILFIVNKVLDILKQRITVSTIIEKADDFIEKNKDLLKYNDLTLYDHQKEIYTIFKRDIKGDEEEDEDDLDENNEKQRPVAPAKLVLYIAPTGTGKTLTPIGLSEQNKIIFVCAARHVGLALAKSAISIKKKIAFAFGCETADDIRLHNYAVKDYVKNSNGEYITYKGGNKKIDNSLGNNVEIMICDIKSFIVAMHYMRAFNKDKYGRDKHDNIIVYWDEPTITLDYENHEFHEIIKRNWNENLIQNVVLSSATLPKLYEITETIGDFKTKFKNNCVIENISSYDCKKSIPIINKDGFVVLPHYLSDDYEQVLQIAKHCENNMTLLRYFDLKGIVDFISFVNANNYISNKWKLEYHFETLENINMTNIKIYYIRLLQNILKGTWGATYLHFKTIRRPKIVDNNKIDANGNKLRKIQSVGPGSSSSSSSLLQGQPISRLQSEQSLNLNGLNSISINENTTNKVSGTAGVYVTTKDAYTLTDGPTIFITNDIEKIANFCIQQANIPAIVMEDIAKKIHYNNGLNEKLHLLENEMEFAKEQLEKSVSSNTTDIGKSKKSGKDIKKINRENPEDMVDKTNISKLSNEINSLRSKLKTVLLNDAFVPNKNAHMQKWADDDKMDTSSCFTSDIDEYVVNEIMLLKGIADSWKVLLMMGIGVFINHENIKYTEIMKKLADEQKLYMIIASSDYIYGTNYQFCHGYLSKDLNLTQEKIIQAMGRIGRTNIQQNYTVRFRDDSQIMKLFTNDTEKPEVVNMNRLFNSEIVV